LAASFIATALRHSIFKTASHSESSIPLLVYTSDDDNDLDLESPAHGRRTRTSVMASTGFDAKTTAIETHDRKLGNAESNDLGDGSNEVRVEGPGPGGSEDTVDELVLEQAIDALESKKTKWWAYLTTRDFWFVLLLGYAVL
jgi:hypothetical protein